MAGFKDSDPKEPTLELSQEELGLLFTAVAGSIIKYSYHRVADNKDGLPVSDDSALPKRFASPVSTREARRIFDPKGNLMVTEAQVSYEDDHLLEEGDTEVLSTVLVSITDRIPGTDYYHDAYYFIQQSSISGYTASVDNQYVEAVGEERRRISFDDIARGRDVIGTGDIYGQAALVDDVLLNEHPMTIDDAAKLRKLAGYLDVTRGL